MLGINLIFDLVQKHHHKTNYITDHLISDYSKCTHHRDRHVIDVDLVVFTDVFNCFASQFFDSSLFY